MMRKKQIARRSHDAPKPRHDQPVIITIVEQPDWTVMCSTSRKATDSSENQQNVDMNKDDKEKQDPMEQKSNVTVSKNRERDKTIMTDTARGRVCQAAMCRSVEVLESRQRWRIERKRRAESASVGST